LKNRQACSGVTFPALKNGHTVPAVATLEKMARALEVPVYRHFHEGEAAVSIRTSKRTAGSQEWGSKGNEADYLSKLCRLLAKMEPNDLRRALFSGVRCVRPRKFWS